MKCQHNLEELKKIDEEDEFFHDEHQRWRAFVKFLEKNDKLSPEIFNQLYELGKDDSDEMMGGSMMKELLDRKDCPIELLKTALKSDKDFLVKTANRAILRRGF